MIEPSSRVPPVHLALAEPAPEEVPVASDIRISVAASCASGADLCGGIINMLGSSGEILASRQLGEQRDGCNAVGELVLEAPERVGEFVWTVAFPRQVIAGIAHPESSLPLSFQTRPHRTSLAVWDIPVPVVTGERFCIKVGARSSGACALAGATVEIRDAAGTVLAHGALGDATLPETSALYWTEIALTAPARAGMFCWTAAFAAQEPELPHLGCATAFSFVAARPPAHRLTIKAVDAQSRAPIEDVQVGFGPYRGATDAEGLAHIDTAAGRYELAVWKSGFAAAPVSIEISKDTRIEIALEPLSRELTVWD